MPKYTLPAATIPGAVSLTVKDLGRSIDFYQDALGFQLHRQQGVQAALGAGGPDLLVLHGNPQAQTSRGTTGLYHFAVRVPTRRDLAFVLQRLVAARARLSGFADHLVSEAIYLPDPDGTGIEIYRDRPRQAWYGPDGSLKMGTDPLDVDGLLGEIEAGDEPWSGLPPGTRMGHVHLHVADLASALHFYRDILGFDLVMPYGPSAAFLSVGGYHHHIGINTWNGVGAPPPPEDATGLLYYTLQLPADPGLDNLVDHLSQNGVPFLSNAGGIWLQDPSANRILVSGTSP